ncbi:hypothetical protein [Oceanimonas smirnovii]|uniref:hypothetical protein n=1 Tax=Oceanimonas smirnovii TaxID=264574 RepID=UPI00036A8FEB|nr:hypothetical protein [Oceanimonas smirnovii]
MDIKFLKKIDSPIKNKSHFYFVSDPTNLARLFIIWFPFACSLVYGIVISFSETIWFELNFTIIFLSWLALWLLLTLSTIIIGNSRHFYLLDINKKTISHLNKNEKRDLDITEEDVKLSNEVVFKKSVLKKPFSSGWHLDAEPAALTSIKEDTKIKTWKIKSLKSHLKSSDIKSAGIIIASVNALTSFVFFLTDRTWLFFASMAAMIVCFFISKATEWLLESRDYKKFQKLLTKEAAQFTE